MAPSRNPPPRSNTGIISNVVGYLGREYDRFIATATGTPLPEDPVSEGDSSHDDEDLVDLSSPLKKSPGRTKRIASPSHVRPDKAKRGHYPTLPEEDALASPNPASSSQDIPSHEQTPEASQSTSSSTSDAFQGRRQRRMSITMPGSLFPRSGSLEPESTPANLDSEVPRHVQWAATPLEVSRKYRSSRDLSIAGSSRLPIPYGSTDLDTEGVPPVQDSPLGKRGVKSVKDAVSQFATGDGEVDSSIMLPNLSTSPSRVSVVSPERFSPRSKGKSRATETSPEKLTPGLVDDDPFLDVESDSSGLLRARAKQKELDVAREEFARSGDVTVEDADQRSQDKLKIQLLEDEVRRLTAELAKHANSTDLSSGDLQMTPAPPAPPPPPPASTYSTPIPYRHSGTGAGTDGLLANVRASLRHAGTPYEAPINDPLFGAAGARVRRKGQPTVPLTNNDDMASFLKELKGAKLRPVSEASMALDASTSGSAPARSNTLARRVTLEDLKRQRAADAERSRSAIHTRSKADRGNLTVDDLQPSRPSSSRMPLRANMTVDAVTVPHTAQASLFKGKGKEILTEGRDRASTVSAGSDVGSLTESTHVRPAEATTGEKRKRVADDSMDISRDGQRRRNFTGLQPPARKAGSKAVHKPARVIPTVSKTTHGQSQSAAPSNIPRPTVPRLYPMPPKIIPVASSSTLPPSSGTDPTPSLTSDNEGSPKDDRHTDPLTTPPKAIPHIDLSKIGFHTDIKTKSPPMQSTIPRQVRGKPPPMKSDAFAGRPPQSPLVIDTPRRPLPPARQGRRSSGGSVFTPDNVGEDDQYQLPVPAAEKQTRRTSQSSQRSHRRPSPLPALHLDTFPTQNAPMREDSARRVRRPPTPPRQRTSSTFADELMRLSSPSLDGDGDEYEIDIDSGVLVTMGTKSKRRGFLAHGGAGGPSVFLGKGYVEGALDSDEEAMEEDLQAQASFDRIARRMSTNS